MKIANFKLIIIGIVYFVLCSLFFVVSASAATPTPATAAKTTPNPTDKTAIDSLSQQITDLKDKIASQVAKLRLVEKRGMVGTVVETSGTQMTIQDLQGNNHIIDVDEITKFSSPDAKGSFGISDISKGMIVSVLGLYNKDSRRTQARFVDVVTLPEFVNGTITKVSKEDYTVTIVDEANVKTIVDIESITKTVSYTKADGLTKSGFSKIEVGNRANIVGYPNKKEKNRMTATRILIFPELPKNPKISVPDNAIPDTGEITPSTGSGKKLTPIK